MKAKFILKISLKNIKSHPLREAVVLVFLAVSLTLFCMSIAASEFSYSEAVAECLYKYEDVYAVYNNVGLDITAEEEEALSSEGVYAKAKYFYNVLPDITCFMAPAADDENSDVGNESDGSVADSLPDPEYVALSDENFISAMGWSVTGRLPSSEYEIAISECLFERFLSDRYYDYINYPWTITENWETVYDERGIKSFSSAEEFLAMSPEVWLGSLDDVTKYEATIVGIIDCGECPVHTGRATSEDMFVGLYDGVFVSEEYFSSVNAHAYMVFAGKDSEEEVLALAEAVNGLDEIDFYSPVVWDLSAQSSVLEQLKTTFLWIAVALVVFSAALTYWVISFSIEKRKGDVGILRANGAKRSDIAFIFFVESLITALAQGALAILASAIAIPEINSTLAEYISVPITFIRLTPFAAACVVLISVLLNALATVVPVVKTASKLPIDSIKNYIE